jgi:hypothetical protein
VKDVATPGLPEERWRLAQEALSGRRGDPDAWAEVGRAAEDLGRRPEAFLHYRKALELDPSKSALVPRLQALAATDEERKAAESLAARPSTFAEAFKGAFAYPLRGGGAALLAIGAVIFSVARGLLGNPIAAVSVNIFNFGPMTVGMTLALFLVWAYVATYFVHVLQHTISGSDDLPEWPDAQGAAVFEDASKVTGALLVAYLPVWVGLAVSVVRVFTHHPPFGWIGGPVVFVAGVAVFGLAGSLYFPMAVLANAVLGPMACFNPVLVARSAAAAPRDYLRCIGACVAVGAGALALEAVVAAGVPAFAAGAAATWVEFYGLAVLMRLLGLFHRVNRARLEWHLI